MSSSNKDKLLQISFKDDQAMDRRSRKEKTRNLLRKLRSEPIPSPEDQLAGEPEDLKKIKGLEAFLEESDEAE